MKNYAILLMCFALLSCNRNGDKADAYGNFESQEIIVSAETSGKILEFTIEKGTTLKEGSLVGIIDTVPLTLEKDVLIAQKQAINSRSNNIVAEIQVLEEQKRTMLVEKERIEKLLEDEAATPKQLDDINGQLNIIEQSIRSIQSKNSNVFTEIKVIDTQIERINDRIRRCYIKCPVDGTVLEKYAEAGELTGQGQSLFKVADLTQMKLTAYIDGSQLASFNIGDQVNVFVDDRDQELLEFTGKVIWISDNAEFTPKIIQTKKERVNLVYAMEVLVENDGRLKIGMPGEIRLDAVVE
jgi:HlyD family secretion protein